MPQRGPDGALGRLYTLLRIDIAIMQPDVLVFLQNNIFLVAVCLVSGGMLLWPLMQKVAVGGKEVSVPQAVQLINRRDALVLDIRDATDFTSGHVPNSRHIPAAELEKRIKELEKFKQKPVIVICRSGTRAATVSNALRKHGFAEVFPLKGGVLGWTQASMPLAK